MEVMPSPHMAAATAGRLLPWPVPSMTAVFRFPALTKCPPQRAMRPATAAHGRMCLAAVHPCLPHGGKKHGRMAKKFTLLHSLRSSPGHFGCCAAFRATVPVLTIFNESGRLAQTAHLDMPLKTAFFYCEPFNASHLPVFSLFLFRTRRSGMTDRDNHCFP